MVVLRIVNYWVYYIGVNCGSVSLAITIQYKFFFLGPNFFQSFNHDSSDSSVLRLAHKLLPQWKKTWVYWGFASLDGWMWWSSTSWAPRKGIHVWSFAELWKDDCRVAPSGAKTHLDLPVFCGFLSRLPKHIYNNIYMCVCIVDHIVYIYVLTSSIYILYLYTHHLIQWPSFPSRHRRIMAHHGPCELGWSAEEIVENGQLWNR
jgi:hypothetical protein